ncbi:beta strand repeat-containing protein, partial [Flavobacterium aestuarii]|uniref:beta strand repeat-containing protein n=1 Tax=Flavobacterium aestuarii TaxID=3149227 RepID=UPI0032B5C184
PSVFASSNIVTVDTNSGADLAWDVYVQDANGCTVKTTVTVIQDAMPSVTAVVSNQCTASGSSFTITATGTGGTGTLTYGINGASGAFQAGNTFNVPASATPYTVWVKDGNQCTASAAAVTVYPQLTSGAAVTKLLDCSASPDAVITTTITGGKAPYTYTVQKGTGAISVPSAPSASLTFTTSVSNANADTYKFVITDANGCTTTASATVIGITNPTVTATPVQVSCNGGNNGSVTLAGSGGSGGYSYSFNGSGFTTTVTYPGLSAGIAYAYQVKDSKGCVSAPATITLTQPTALVVSASATSFSCNTSNVYQSAVVTINVPTTGTAPYTYSFDGGGYSTTRTKTYNDNGSNQTVNYSVKDSKGCTQAGTAIILNRLNPPVIANISGTPIYCSPAASTTSTVTVTRTAGTGVGALTYAITAPAAAVASNATGVFTGLAGGTTYTFKVTDANGCYDTKSFTVPSVTPIAVTASKLTDVDCFGNNTGSISYNVSGFSGTYSYTVNGGAAVTGQTAASFTLSNRVAGVYNVVFTDAVTGCSAPTSITIAQPAAALSATVAKVNANCITTTSKVTITATGGTSPYTYAYKIDGVPPLAADYIASNIANLNPATNANWDVWVKDANGCTFKLDVAIILDPTPTVTASATAQCLGAGSYTITANGLGGTGTLTYSINGGSSYQSGNTFVVTTSGSYTIKVKDVNGCTADSNVINVAPQLTLNAVLNKNITCNPAPTAARITLTPTGGVGPFTYTASPNTGTFAANIFTTSAAGNYTFTVTDTATGCTYTTTTAIPVTTPVNPDITGVTQTAFINCNGDDTAAISITVNNTLGQSPFVFNVRRTAPTVFDYGTQTSGLSAGTYAITVTDAKGCTDTFPFVINEPTPIVFSRSITPITCNNLTGISLGRITINSVSGGTPNYIYHVTGVNGYDKKFSNQTGLSVVFDVVDFGFYQIIITDSNGCTAFENNILIASPPDDLDITVTSPPADCSAPGSAIIAVGGPLSSVTGPGPYHFAVYSPGLTYTGPTALPWYDEDAVGSKKTTIPNLLPGVTYTFVVHDALTGCYYFETSTLPIPTNSTITVNPIIANNITCKGMANGNVTFTMNHTYGASTPVTYQIFNSQSVTPIGSAVSTTIPASGSLVINNFGVLPFGNYFVLVTETGVATHAGCSVTSAPFDITESAIDLSVTASKIKKVNCNEDGVIAAQAKDGTAPYTYQYLLASVPAPTAGSAGWVSATTFETSTTGNYIVYAKDAYGCIKNASVTLDANIAPTINLPAPICYNNTAFTINIVGTVDPTIVGDASYSVDGSAFQDSPNFTFNAAKTYNLVIKDGNGCTANVDYVVHPKLELTTTLTKELDCTGMPNATITLTTTGGDTTPTANYTYEYSTTGGGPWTMMATNVLSAPIAGTYTFRVTDANNATLCQTIKAIVLDPIPTTVFGTTQTNVSCNGGSDGTIKVNVTAGEGPYAYDLTGTGSNNTGDVTGIYTGLPAGNTYVVTVRNAKSCVLASAPINITQPSLLTATSSITTPLTCGTGNVAQPATVTVVATPGTGTSPYKYSFDGGANYSPTNTYQTYAGTAFDVYVKDANGCIFTLTNGVNVPALVAPSDLMFSTTVPVTCLVNGTVEITGHTGGVGILNYETIAPSPIIRGPQTTTTFANLTPGTYLFQVKDANGCTYQESYTVDPVTPIAIVGSV